MTKQIVIGQAVLTFNQKEGSSTVVQSNICNADPLFGVNCISSNLYQNNPVDIKKVIHVDSGVLSRTTDDFTNCHDRLTKTLHD